MFRGLESGALRVIGWPWHGQIVDDMLELSSGEQMYCAHGGWNTQLWDIGMPDPGVEGDTPDEQWWNKAIIRWEGNAAVIYSGRSAESGAYRAPMRIGEELIRNVSLNTGGHDGPIITLRTRSGVTASATISRADLGIPPSNTYIIYSSVIDMDMSRGRWIVRFDDEFEYVLAFALVQLAPGEDGVEMSISVIADYSEAGVFTGVESTPLNVPDSQYAMWSGGADGSVITYAEVTDVEGSWNWTWNTIGEHVATAKGSSIVGAWFGDNGEIERLRGWVETERRYNGAITGQYSRFAEWEQTGTTWLESEGGTKVSDAISFGYTLESRMTARYTTTDTIRRYLDGVLVDERIEVHDADIGPRVPRGDVVSWGGVSDQAVHGWFGYQMGIWGGGRNISSAYIYGSVGGNSASNKLRQPHVRIIRYDGSTVGVYGHALHPRGVEAKRTPFDSATMPGATTVSNGTYNPITGEVVLNPTDGRKYSWV